MFGLGPWEILMILVIVVILFGAGRLPETLGQLRNSLKEFKKGAEEPAALPKETSKEAEKHAS